MTRSWDAGVVWFSNVLEEPTALAVDVAYMADQILKVTNGHAEDAWIEQAIRAASDVYRDDTQRALMRETRELVLSGFPGHEILLPFPPLIAVVSLTYYDSDDVAQTLSASPQAFETVRSGTYTKGAIRPLRDTAWPATSCRPDAVTITYQAGYEEADAVPARIVSGLGMLVVEMYKTRGLSTQTVINTKNVLDTSRFWRRQW